MASNAAVPISLGYDPDMGVPLAGQEGYRPKGSGDGFIDERFGGLDDRGSGVGSSGLKKFIEEQVAASQPASTVHVSEHVFRIYWKDGAWRAKGEVDGQVHRFSASDRDALIAKLMPFARRDSETIRNLDEAELSEVARLAQRDRVAAINLFLSLAVPEGYADGQDANKLINDPSLRGFMERVCEFVWLNSRLDATDSEQWQQFKQTYISSRPVSCALLDRCWDEFCEQRNRRLLPPGELLLPPKEEPPTAQEIADGLEDMTDEQVAKQYWAVAKAHAGLIGT